MTPTEQPRRHLVLTATIILLAWLAPVVAGRPPAPAQQPPAQAPGMLGVTANLGDGVVCQILFPVVDIERVRVEDGRVGVRMVQVGTGGPRNQKEQADITNVINTFVNALKSDDMRKKVREACTVHQAKTPNGEYQFVVGLTWNDSDVMSAGQLVGLNQIAVDLSDISQVGEHLSGGSQAAQDVVSNNWLTSVMAHEFDHARDGPGQAGHRDPEGQCASDPRNPGEPTRDQNAVIADLQLGHTRVQYIYTTQAGVTNTDYNVVLPNGETHTVTMNITTLTGATFTDLPPPPQPQGPPAPQPQGPPAPQPQGPPAPQPQGPPAPQPQGPPAPQPQGPPAPPRQRSGANNIAGLPERTCAGTTTTGCFGPAGVGDTDFDGVPNTVDNCPLVANPQQGDRNGNAIGDACDRSLPPCSAGWSFTDPKVYGSIGGAVLGGVLIGVAGGGEAPTANTLTPTANPNPNPTPAPNPNPAPAPAPTPEPTPAPPPPPPRTTADGIYRCVEVVVVSDEGRHNGTIALGPQLTGNFDVREGSISIRHPAPFVDIVGAQFDTASGAFSGTAVGPVAGSPTVGVRADGTVTTSTGRIVFNYAMGTGGELPGGRPIVYRITLQKQ